MKQASREKQRLVDCTVTRIRFSEVDAIGIVWHGNFVKYLEDGRESFGRSYGLGYFDVFEHGLLTPVVKMEIDFRAQVKCGEEIIIETTFLNTDAAKILFEYRILRKQDRKLIVTATTTQVFVDRDGELELTNPEFYLDWKRKHGIIGEGKG
jgi:acyl-CoA thioester hydrolase